MMGRASILAVAAAVLLAAAPQAAAGKRGQGMQTLTGPAIAMDGDTIMMSLTRIRITGMDAFERGQTCTMPGGAVLDCGAAAAEAMAALVQDRTVTCDLSGRLSYGRPLAHCTVAGRDLAAAMVEQGWAVVDPRFEQTHVPLMEAARRNRRGAWAGTFVTPCAYRGSC